MSPSHIGMGIVSIGMLTFSGFLVLVPDRGGPERQIDERDGVLDAFFLPWSHASGRFGTFCVP